MNILGTAFFSIVSINACLAFYLKVNKVEVFPGQSVLLPCNSSGFPTDELHWEAMGKHVAVLRDGHITAGQGYEDRVFLKDPTASDDFSLVLRDVMFSDGGIYACLWRSQKPVCSVFVNVLESLNVPVLPAVGEDVTLDCFGHVPSNNPLEDIDLHWLKDEREVLRFTSGKIDFNVDNSHMSLPVREKMSRGIFSLNIRSVRAQDQGVYQCRYKSTDHEDLKNGLPETQNLILLDVSPDVSSTSESILSTSSGSYTQTNSSVPSWMSVASTEWSGEISTSAQTSADTAEVVFSEMSSTVASIHNTSNTSYTQTGTSVPTWTDVTSTEWSSPVSTHSLVERTDNEDISTASAQTSADTGEVVSSEMSSTIASIHDTSNTSYTQTGTSVPTWTDVTSTEWSSPVSTHPLVERTDNEDISTASAQTSADTVEVVSSEMSSTVASIHNTSYTQTGTSVPTWTDVTSTEWSSPVSTDSFVERTDNEDISTASAQTSADTVEVVSSEMSSTVALIHNTSNTSYTQTGTSVPTWTDVTSTEWSSPVSTHSLVEGTDNEDISTASAQTSADTGEVVSSEMSSTVASIHNTSNTSYTQTGTSVPTWTDVTSTEWSSPVSTDSYVERTDTENISTASADTVEDVSSEMSSTVALIHNTSNTSYTQTGTSVPTWTDVTSTEWSSPVSTDSYVERTDNEDISTASAQTSADTVEVVSSEMSSTVALIHNTSNTSYTQTGTSVPTWTDVTSTEWSSPVSTHSLVERTDNEDISTASAQTSADTGEVVSSEMSSTIASIHNTSNTSYTQTGTSVPTWTDVTSTEWSSPVSTNSYVERTDTENISTASADTVEDVSSEMSSTVESIPSASSSSWTHVASTESLSPVSHVERSETGDISTTSAEEITDVSPVLEAVTSSGQYGSLELLSDEKIPWMLIGLISGVLLITAGVLTLLMLFARN